MSSLLQTIKDNLTLKVAAAAGVAVASGVAAYYYFTKSGCCDSKKKVKYLPNCPDVVVVDYKDLLDDNCDLSESIEAAFGHAGLGLITVSGVPGVLERANRLYEVGYKFATLPESIKEKYAHPESKWNFGWSHGKEKFLGQPDVSKGSFYANPIHDKPFGNNAKLIEEYPSFATPNIWPTEDSPEFEPAFKELGSLMVEVGARLAYHCDKFAKARYPSYPDGQLQKTVLKSRCHKGRFLHYFPADEAKLEPSTATSASSAAVTDDDFGSWCGWHNDHGSLTALCPARYFDKDGNQIPCPDPKAGLYIRTRTGKVVRAVMPATHLAFQMGETNQVVSGGTLKATPHAVRAAVTTDSKGVSRETLAVFMEPEWDFQMNIPVGATESDATLGKFVSELPPGVPPLKGRWTPGISFGDFSNRTLNAFNPTM